MSAGRKLLAEIQQVLKKVDEGVELFDEISEKVYSATQQSLKEKYETDLKKEIKKLQRFRDQIKNWISSNEIKDKTQLLEARKVIETKMEEFKVCEKDTKIKAYSKEGLARDSKQDPKEVLKEEKRGWINGCLEQLAGLVDSVEADQEKLLAGKGSKAKNKAELEKINNRIQKHKWHTNRLEQILKLIENDELEPTDVDTIKDSVEYYIESADDDDGAVGVEDEFDIYEDLQLDNYASINIALPAAVDVAHGKTSKDEAPENAKRGVVVDAGVADAAKADEDSKENVDEPSSNAAAKKGASTNVTKGISSIISSVGVGSKTHAAATSTPAGKVHKSAAESTAEPNLAPAAPESETKSAPAAVIETAASSPPLTTLGSWAQHATKAHVDEKKIPAADEPPKLVEAKVAEMKAVPEPSATAQNPSTEVNLAASTASITSPTTNASTTQEKPPAAVATKPTPPQSASQPPQQKVQPPPAQLTPEMMSAMNMLKASLLHTPDLAESEKQPSYTPRNFFPNTHPSYPTTPVYSGQADNAALFERLPMDTLFFAFYYQQGSLQQYLAAKQLKKHSWRFHKKYYTWFQRHEEPKIATEEYEEGTYVYFDYESGWCQRIKSEFKFEYAYLEDEINGSSVDA